MTLMLQPKNWDRFQHYKDRSPPWIKFHRDILNDRKFMCLPTASKALAPLLWLLASESQDAIFDASPEELHFRLRMDTKEIEIGLTHLIENGFFVKASGELAECLRDASPEESRVEVEREIEREVEVKKKGNRASQIPCPQDVEVGVWEDWLQLRKQKKASVSETVIQAARGEAQKLNWSLNQFLKEWCLRGSQGLKAEWITNNQSDRRTEHQKRQDATARALLGDAYYATPTLTAVEGEVVNEEFTFAPRLGR